MKKFPLFNEYTTSNSTAAVINYRQLHREWMSHVVQNFKKFPIISRNRLDLIADEHFKDNLKENLRRGVGSRLLFDDSTKLPAKFHSEFLKNGDSKNKLGHYLPKKPY